MDKSNDYAPIVLFVYNRVDHTKQTLEALQKNDLADESELYIYADAPKNVNAEDAVKEVREYIKTIDGFKSISIIEREENFGLAASIINGVSSVIQKHGKVIVLEDDLITGKYFLDFMNRALITYADTKKIFSVTGFSFSTEFMGFLEDYDDEVYLNIRPMSWSWATWSDRWEGVDWEVKEYDNFIRDSKEIKRFNRGGTDLTRMLKLQMNEKVDSWYIRWTFHAFQNEKLTVYPKVSYVNNIGHDASGVHGSTDEDKIYGHTELNNSRVNKLDENIKLDDKVVKRFNQGFDLNYFKIAKRKLSKFFRR